MSDAQKTCVRCGRAQSLALFPKNGSNCDGRSSWCKACYAEYQRAGRDARTALSKLSLRDYFAGQALLGITRHWQQFCEDHFDDPSLNEPQSRWHQRAAIQAYQYADAMLAERDKPKAEPPAGEQPNAD